MRLKGNSKTLALLIVAILLIFTACSSSNDGKSKNGGGKAAEASAQPEKTVKLGDITFVVPYSAGGGFDTMARTLAPYLEKNLSGSKVVVKNVPGGNGIIGINEVVLAKPNGQTIGIFNLPGFFVEQLTGKANYDLTKIAWVGQASQVTYVAAASPKSGLKTLDDLKKQSEVLTGIVGLNDTAAVGAFAAADSLGYKLKAVPHKGSTEAILSAIRGDVQFVQFPIGSLQKHIVNSNDLVPLWVYSDKRLPELPNVPTIVDLGKPELLDIVSLIRDIGTTPGTPPEVLKVLRDAFAKAMKDPELMKKMKDGNMEPLYLDADKTLKSVENMKKQMEKYKNIYQ